MQKSSVIRPWYTAWMLGLALLGLALLAPGCSGDAEPGPGASRPREAGQTGQPFSADERPDSARDPRNALREAFASGDWVAADRVVDAALIRYPEDSQVLRMAARVAYENSRQDQAASLMVEAAGAERYADATWVQQSVIALVGVGRLMDAIDLLGMAVSARPDDLGVRRLLFDLLMGVDDRAAAFEHARVLVLGRKFDVDLLTQWDNGNRRKEENESYQQMVSRHSADKRPLTGKARTELDRGDLDSALATASEIVQRHPDWIPARMIQGRALVQLDRPAELDQWFDQSTARDRASPWYWVIRGDVARRNGDLDAAIGAYLQAIACDPELLQAWQRADVAIETHRQDASSGGDELDADAAGYIRSQANRLARLRQAREDFLFGGKSSPARAVRVAETLDSLGRLWEAEAWAAVAVTLKSADDPETKAAKAFRQELVTKLRTDLPWNMMDHDARLSSLRGAYPPPPSDRSRVARDIPRRESSGRFDHVGKLAMVDVAQARGIRFHGKPTDAIDRPGLLLYASTGCGIGVIDIDLDGWPDLFCADAGGNPTRRDSRPGALFRNLDGQFQDVTVTSGAGDRGFGQGVCVGDLNEDGFPDLWLANYGPNRVMINNGDGTFTDATSRWLSPDSGKPDSGKSDSGKPVALTQPPARAVADSRWTTSSAIVDLDADGISDLWEVNYCAGLEATYQKCESKAEGPASSVCAPIAFLAQPDRVFAGTTSGGLIDVTDQWCDASNVPGRGLGIVAGRFDADDRIDVLVSNDMTNNHFWIRSETGTKRWTEAAALRGLAADGRSQPQGSMGIAVGDFDGDQTRDVYVTNFAAEYNTLHCQNATPGFWDDRTASFGLAQPTIPLVGFGTRAIDIDNDSNLELFVSNGHIDPILEYAQPAQIFQKSASSKFVLVDAGSSGASSSGASSSGASSSGAGYLSDRHVGRAVASVDFDRDGRVDLAVTHQTEPVALLENRTETDNHWIRFQVAGIRQARDAIGTLVTVNAGHGTHQVSKFSGGGYLASSEPVLHVGLGPHAGPVDVTVQWIGGPEQTFRSIAVDRQWLLVQGQAPFSLDQTADGAQGR